MSDNKEIDAPKSLELFNQIVELVNRLGQTVGHKLRRVITVHNCTDNGIYVTIEKNIFTDEINSKKIAPNSIETFGRNAGEYKVKMFILYSQYITCFK